MEPVTSAIVGALVAAATAIGKSVASEAAKDVYGRLKSLIAGRFGRSKAVEAIEEAPASASARVALEGALAETGADRDAEVGRLASELAAALEAMEPAALQQAGIRVSEVVGFRNAIVRGLDAEGGIAVERVEAKTGDAVVENLSARRRNSEKN